MWYEESRARCPARLTQSSFFLLLLLWSPQGRKVWFGGVKDYLLPGTIKAVSGKNLSVEDEEGALHTVPAASCKIMGATSENGVEDMIQLQDLHEGSLLYNLAIRYKTQKIYTFTGSILVAVNPYQAYNIYSIDVVRKYEGQLIGTLPPHIFGI